MYWTTNYINTALVPGHTNIVGNEVADEFAGGGSQSIEMLIDETVKPPIDFMSAASKKLLSKKPEEDDT